MCPTSEYKVTFEAGRATLSDADREAIVALAGRARACLIERIVVHVSHADDVALTQQRQQQIASELLGAGLPLAMISHFVQTSGAADAATLTLYVQLLPDG